jgi:Na+/melibiose symporter-like transporter
VMFTFSAPAIILGVLWFITGREPRKDELPASTLQSVPFRQALSKVVRIKEVWVLALMQTLFWGSTHGLLGYLSLYFKNNGWNMVAADSIPTILMGAGMIGVIPMTLLAKKLGSTKGMLFFSIISCGLGIFALPFVPENWVYYVVFISGFLYSAEGALLTTMVFEIKGVGSTYGGTANGLVTSLAMLGAFIGAPIGNSLEPVNSALPFIFWSILCVASLLGFFFLRKKDTVSISEANA